MLLQKKQLDLIEELYHCIRLEDPKPKECMITFLPKETNISKEKKKGVFATDSVTC
jgi:hypothetical protein